MRSLDNREMAAGDQVTDLGEGQTNATRLWTLRDVSAFLAVPVGTLYQWRVRGEGPPAMRLGRHLRFDPSEVRRWADSHHGAA